MAPAVGAPSLTDTAPRTLRSPHRRRNGAGHGSRQHRLERIRSRRHTLWIALGSRSEQIGHVAVVTQFSNVEKAADRAPDALRGLAPPACTNPHYTDTWRDEGGTPYVVEQILDASAGATAHIVALHGAAEARKQLAAVLQAFANEHPQCAPELRRFAREASG